MKKLLGLLAALGLLLTFAGTALAADGGSSDSGPLLVSIQGDVDIAAGQEAGTVIVIDADARIAGTVGSLVILNGTASTESGAVLDSITVIRSTADLATGTTVNGDINRLDSTVNRADGVTVSGTEHDLTTDAATFGLFIGAAAILFWLGFAIVSLLIGLVIAALAARQVRQATALISHEPVWTFLVGLLTVIVVPLVAVLAFITVVGIPASLVLMIVVLPAAAFVGYMVAAIWIGEWVLARMNPSAPPRERPYAAVVVGLVVAFILGFIPLVTTIISLFGLGAVVLAAWRTFRGRPIAAGAPVGQQQPTPAM